MESFQVKVPDGCPVYPNTHDDWFNFPFVLMSVAKRYSGKTASLSYFLHVLKRMDRLDRLILVSPTYHTNAHYFRGLPLADEDVLEPDIDTAARVMDIVEEEARLFDEYHEKMKRWQDLQREIRSRKHVNEIDENLLLEFESMEKPTYRYMRNGKPYKPILVMFADDCQGTDFFSPSRKNRLNYMTIKHRHIGAIRHGDGKAIGINLMFAIQNYTSSTLGLSRSIRGNSSIICVFRNKNMNELKLIAEEVAGEVDVNTFFKLFEEATSIPYGFLTIDLNPKKTAKSMFRQNFCKYLFP